MKVFNENSGVIEVLALVVLVGDESIYSEKLTDSELSSLGYYKLKYNPIPSRKYFNSIEDRKIIEDYYVISYISTEKGLDELKARMVKELKEVQNNKLSEIDWYWQRELKVGILVPQEIKDLALGIYETSSLKEVEIANLSTIEEIMLYEATPKESEEFQLGTQYINNVKDW